VQQTPAAAAPTIPKQHTCDARHPMTYLFLREISALADPAEHPSAREGAWAWSAVALDRVGKRLADVIPQP